MKSSHAEEGEHDVDVPYPWPRGALIGSRAEKRVRNVWILISIVLFAVLCAVVTAMAATRW